MQIWKWMKDGTQTTYPVSRSRNGARGQYPKLTLSVIILCCLLSPDNRIRVQKTKDWLSANFKCLNHPWSWLTLSCHCRLIITWLILYWSPKPENRQIDKTQKNLPKFVSENDPHPHTQVMQVTMGTVLLENEEMSRDIWFPTMWHFDKCKTQTSLGSLLLRLETPNGVQSVAYRHS